MGRNNQSAPASPYPPLCNIMRSLLTIGGRIAKGFDFLGYSFEPKGLSIAPKTLANFLDRITQLYEQGADVRRIGKYVRNWWRWVRAGVEISVVTGAFDHHINRSFPFLFLFPVAETSSIMPCPLAVAVGRRHCTRSVYSTTRPLSRRAVDGLRWH